MGPTPEHQKTHQDDPRGWFKREAKRPPGNSWAERLHEFAYDCISQNIRVRIVMAEVDLRTVQELMGHKVIGMTVRCAHLAPRHQLSAVQRLCETEGAQSETTGAKTDTTAFEQRAVRESRPN
jgi:hypothetical protein